MAWEGQHRIQTVGIYTIFVVQSEMIVFQTITVLYIKCQFVEGKTLWHQSVLHHRNEEIRFDILSVLVRNNQCHVNHIPDAFKSSWR